MAHLRSTLVAVVIGVATARAWAGGAVATEHRLAAEAGAELLAAGGTVVDAALAAAAAVCVVHASSCGIGGGGFALVHGADGTDAALDYRETAPAGATPDRYVVAGRPDERLLRTGGLAVAVPGEIAGWTALHRRFGRLPLRRVLAPAIRVARGGFTLAESPHLAGEIARQQKLLAADPGLRGIFLAADGGVPGPDFRVVQPDLARTLERVADEGARAFYADGLATAIADAVAARGGVLSAADLRSYRPVWRRPLVGRFRGRRVVTFPPPGSGAIVLETLGILARDDLPSLGAGTATTLHLVASAMAQAFADRARWFGDPAFTDVPVDALLAPPRLRALRARLSAIRVTAPDDTLRADAGTANVSVIDDAGNAAVVTTTINTAFGAGILVPGTGIVLNNEMDDFAVAPGVPNAFGLVGSSANAVLPRKRPQSSMSPTVVFRGRRAELVVGGSGGPTIISGVLQAVLGVVAFGLDPARAVAAPRIHDQAVAAAVAVEPGIDAGARAALVRVGHRLVEIQVLGAVSAVGLDAAGRPVAAGDHRKDGGETVVP